VLGVLKPVVIIVNLPLVLFGTTPLIVCSCVVHCVVHWSVPYSDDSEVC